MSNNHISLVRLHLQCTAGTRESRLLEWCHDDNILQARCRLGRGSIWAICVSSAGMLTVCWSLLGRMPRSSHADGWAVTGFMHLQAHPGIHAAVASWPGGAAFREALHRIPYCMTTLVYQRDSGSGRVRLDSRGMPRLSYCARSLACVVLQLDRHA